MHSWQETDLPVLSRESGLEENVQKPVGKTSHTFRSTLGFHSLLCRVVTSDSNYCANNLLCFAVRVTTNYCDFPSRLCKENDIMYIMIQCPKQCPYKIIKKYVEDNFTIMCKYEYEETSS